MQRALALVNQGFSYGNIAMLIGVDKSTVCRWVQARAAADRAAKSAEERSAANALRAENERLRAELEANRRELANLRWRDAHRIPTRPSIEVRGDDVRVSCPQCGGSNTVALARLVAVHGDLWGLAGEALGEAFFLASQRRG